MLVPAGATVSELRSHISLPCSCEASDSLVFIFLKCTTSDDTPMVIRSASLRITMGVTGRNAMIVQSKGNAIFIRQLHMLFSACLCRTFVIESQSRTASHLVAGHSAVDSLSTIAT